MRDKLQGIWDAIVFCNDNTERYAHIDLDKIDSDFIAIDNALERLEKQDEILQILNENDVDIYLLKRSKNLEEYNLYHLELEQQEFDLLKEWLK